MPAVGLPPKPPSAGDAEDQGQWIRRQVHHQGRPAASDHAGTDRPQCLTNGKAGMSATNLTTNSRVIILTALSRQQDP